MIILASQVSVKCLIIAQDKKIKTTSKDLCVTMEHSILWIFSENQVKFE